MDATYRRTQLPFFISLFFKTDRDTSKKILILYVCTLCTSVRFDTRLRSVVSILERCRTFAAERDRRDRACPTDSNLFGGTSVGTGVSSASHAHFPMGNPCPRPPRTPARIKTGQRQPVLEGRYGRTRTGVSCFPTAVFGEENPCPYDAPLNRLESMGQAQSLRPRLRLSIVHLKRHAP